MTVVGTLLAAYAALALAYWLWALYSAIRVRLAVPLLSALDAPEPPSWPKLSVIVPACNEADTIEPAVRTLLDEDYPDLEVILVDDRSADATGEILDRVATEDDRVTVLHVTELPGGWLGKVNALSRGLAESSGAFVLFTDADVHFERGTLRKAVAWCEKQGLDHLAAFPTLRPGTILVDATTSVFIRQLIAAIRPWAVGHPKSRAFTGIGAFNLVRRSAFEATPGFEWLRLEVADDMGLGMMMKRSGARCGVVAAFGNVGLHWYRSLREAARGAEKAYASVAGCSLLRMLTTGLTVLAMGMIAPLLALVPLAFAPVRLIGCAGIAVFFAFLCSTVLLTRWGRVRTLPALLGPLVSLVTTAVLIRAGLMGWRRGGVVWRGTLYCAKDLREGSRIRFP